MYIDYIYDKESLSNSVEGNTRGARAQKINLGRSKLVHANFNLKRPSPRTRAMQKTNGFLVL